MRKQTKPRLFCEVVPELLEGDRSGGIPLLRKDSDHLTDVCGGLAAVDT